MVSVTGRSRVAVSSNLRLLAETLAAALEDSGLEVIRLAWPGREQGGPSRPSLSDLDLDVALLVCEPSGTREVDEIRELLAGYRGRSLVMVGVRPGPWWGAMLEAGADAVLASSTSLGELLEAVEDLVNGGALMGVVERQVLMRQWLATRADQQALRDKLDLLTPREREVLDLLHEGASAAAIAEQFGVSQTTVRSQIRAVLAKLGVRTQLGAVAVLESVLAELTNGH